MNTFKTAAYILIFNLLPTLLGAQVTSANSAAEDFPQTNHYRESNLAVLESGIKVTVVFLGDSVTEYWGARSGKWFEDKGWINRGIGGQTTAQLLLRERTDALNFHPDAIVLEGGSNDMRLGFASEEIIERFRTMGELAEAHHIAVFVETMTPTCDCFRQLSGLRSVDRIRQLNEMLANMCREKRWILIDVSSPLANAEGHMKKELTVDGVHPNDAGYALMYPRVEQALRSFMSNKP
jgi:lysophospholipase L1-like esterase